MNHSLRGAAVIAGASAVVVAGCGGVEPRPVPPLPHALTQPQLITKASPGVVAIKARTQATTYTGTGWMIGPREVMTAAHVINNAENIKVRFQDGTSVSARIKGEQVCADRALLELTEDPPATAILPMADDEPLAANSPIDLLHYGRVAVSEFSKQGMTTSPLTVANPEVKNPSLGASFPRLTNLIQLQGVVPPGASGGPTLDTSGRVTGMIVIGETDASQGYALSIGDLRRTLPALRGGDRSDSLGLEMTPIAEMNLPSLFAHDPDYRRWGSYLGRAVERILRRNGTSGLYIDSSADNSPAAKAVYAGDMITSVNGVKVRSVRGLCGVIQSAGPGERLTIRGLRINSGTRFNQVLESWTEHIKTRS